MSHTSRPVASIVIPCYNAERYLEATLESALDQSVDALEVICVDDGSTDKTAQILEAYAARDPRVRVLLQENGGEGPARDAGLVAARGSWIYCLDADDLMEPTLLAEAIACAERTEADVVIFKTRLLDDQSGELSDFRWCFDTSWLPEGTEVFSPSAHPERIFNSFQNWVHNKLFRASFVREKNLHFQHIHRTADLLFTCRALSEAARIALLNKALHRYRTNNPNSALFTSDLYPLDFYEALHELQTSLEEAGTWDLYKQSFVNWAIEGVAGNLCRARSQQSFERIAQAMREGGLARLGFESLAREDSYNLTQWDICNAILTLPPQDLPLYIIRVRGELIDLLDRIIGEQQQQIESLYADNMALVGSTSFKLGRSLTAPLRAVRDLRLGAAQASGEEAHSKD